MGFLTFHLHEQRKSRFLTPTSCLNPSSASSPPSPSASSLLCGIKLRQWINKAMWALVWMCVNVGYGPLIVALWQSGIKREDLDLFSLSPDALPFPSPDTLLIILLSFFASYYSFSISIIPFSMISPPLLPAFLSFYCLTCAGFGTMTEQCPLKHWLSGCQGSYVTSPLNIYPNVCTFKLHQAEFLTSSTLFIKGCI